MELAQLAVTGGSSLDHLLVRFFRRLHGRNRNLRALNSPFRFLQSIREGGRLLSFYNEPGLERL
jgi:hypothetical protein